MSAAHHETGTAVRELASEPQANEYDVVVVGAGMGGITAASLLAKAGMKVLLVEAHEAPGGYVHSFEREGYVFDPAVHLVVDPPMFERMLDHLEVRDRVNFIKPDTLFTAHLPGFKFHVPQREKEEFIETHVRLFPEYAAEIREFWEVCAVIHRQAHELPPRIGIKQLEEVAAQFEVLFKYRKATLQQGLDEYLPDPKVQAACSMSCVNLGLPPNRLSFVLFAQMAFSQVINGASYVEGGVQRLVDAYVDSVHLYGGEVIVRNQVSAITTDDGRATGVRLQDGSEIKASAVVSNADPFRTYGELIGEDKAPPSVMRSLRRLRMSTSAFVMFAATDMDIAQFDPGHLCNVSLLWDMNEALSKMLGGEPTGASLNLPTLVDPSVAPPGQHVLSVICFAPYDLGRPWPEAKPEVHDKLLRVLDAVVPDVSKHLDFAESSTPLTIERYTRNHHGAVYGWENTADQTGSKRPLTVTPIDGLYLVGSWTAPGAGFLRAVASGAFAAEQVLERAGSGVAIPRFMSAA